MAKDVKIPVKVDGAQQASSDLAQTGRAVENLGRSGKKAAADLQGLKPGITPEQQQADEAAFKAWREQERHIENVGAKTKDASKATALFGSDVKQAANALLGFVNPALAETASRAAEASGGLKSMGPGLISLAGGALVLEGIAALWREVAAAAQAAEEAQKRAVAAARESRDAFLQRQQSIAEALHEAGVFGAAPEAGRAAERIQRTKGVSPELADFAAKAQAIGNVPDEALDDLLAGANVTSGEQFGADAGKNRALIERLIQRGRSDDARRALRGHVRDMGGVPVTEAQPMSAFDPGKAALDRAEDEIAKRHPEMTEQAVKAAREAVEGNLDEHGIAKAVQKLRGGPAGGILGRLLSGGDKVALGPEGAKDLEDAKALIAELRSLLERIRQGQAVPGGSAGPVGAAGAGFTVNIHEETNVTNVAQQNQLLPDHLRRMPPDTLELEAWNR